MKSYKGQLVCQHLENISRDALEKYQAIIKKYVRGRHGIYALYKKDKLYYVGLASNLSRRLNSYLRGKHAKKWDRFNVYFIVKGEHLKELESFVLRIASPKGNSSSGHFIRSQDLKCDFKSSFSEFQKKERESLVGTKQKEFIAKPVSKKNDRLPALAKINRKFKIRMLYKGKLHKAVVRKNGTIRYKEKVYNSPSSVAQAVRGLPSNGWIWWKYERAPGDWVMLDELRKR